MAIPIANLNPLPPPIPAAANPATTAPTGLFQATLANAAVQQTTTTPLLTYLEDTGQLEAVQQADFPPPTATPNATTTNTANPANNPSTLTAQSLAAQLGDETINSNVNENGTTAADYVVAFRFPGLIQQNLAALAYPPTGTSGVSTGSTTATAAGTPTLTEQLRLQVAGTTRSGTTEVGTTTAQTPGSQIPPATPTVPPAVAIPAAAQPATTGVSAAAVPIPTVTNSATASNNNPTTAAVLAAQNQVIPAQIPIVTGLPTSSQTPTQLTLATPESVPAPVATGALPSAQTGERPVMAGDRLAVIAQEGANLQSTQSQSSVTFQSLLAQAVPGTGAAQSPTGTTPVAGAPTRIVATGASLTSLSAQPSASTVAALTNPATPTSSVPLVGNIVEPPTQIAATAASSTALSSQPSAGIVATSTSPATPTSSVPVSGGVGGPQTPGSPLQSLDVEVGGQQRPGIVAGFAVAGGNQPTATIATAPTSDTTGASTLLANAYTTATTPSPSPAVSAPPTAASATLATQVADGVISHAQALNQNGTTEFRMRLDPPELGPVNVHLVSTGDEIRGHVVVASDSVRQMIESQLPELRQRLEAAGVTVQNFNVTADPSGGGNRNARQEPAPDSPNPLPTMTRFRTNTTTRRSGQVDVVV